MFKSLVIPSSPFGGGWGMIEFNSASLIFRFFSIRSQSLFFWEFLRGPDQQAHLAFRLPVVVNRAVRVYIGTTRIEYRNQELWCVNDKLLNIKL